MKKEYSYPLDLEWSTDEMVIVMEMWQALEDIYEKGLKGSAFLEIYRRFKTVVKSLGEERKLGKEFESLSGYSLYRAVLEAKDNSDKLIHMKGD